MKKELIISILIGFGLGLIITFGVYNARMAVKEQQTIVSPVPDNNKQNGEQETTITQSLSIISPTDQTIINTAKTQISGVTSPLSWVVIFLENGEKIIQADNKGNFGIEVTLITGENEIEIHSVSEKGEEVSKIITVVFSTVEI